MFMITKFYYSSLQNRFYPTKKEAQTAEDKYVEEYFEKIETLAAIKRRKRRILINSNSSKSKF